ncbi:bifunctional diguanylate cyclase/phosphodiesterase [Herbiconiux sp. CPCC 205763]|uniref:Bifunctional diguanylate cyclase/phosphodiesterase n=1 Tax=Herbiconiux aconitum TaxID=2970913 RepID=A0ABT2GS53_9MICO|nr:bifunctional diguanylate cyclase/phosphodiesterase [Herbiconiux aconitum]MCS5718125.1 bifunctional diguanylate cyclase/phosphodiesterase [Herbiconiux aconitum]
MLLVAVAGQIVYVISLIFPVTGTELIVDAWVSMIAEWTAVLTCWTAFALMKSKRIVPVLGSVAVTATVLGDSLFLAATDGDGVTPFPSPADLSYLAFYLLLLAAIILAARDLLAGRGAVVVFDVIVGSLGAASVLALVLTPVLDSTIVSSDPVASVLSLSYPVLDVLLIAALVGVRASDRSGASWMPLILGLVLFAGADIVYAMDVPGSGYVVGTLLDAAWSVGVLLIVLWVCLWTVPGEPALSPTLPSRVGTAVAVLAIVCALAVLVIAPAVSGSAVAVVLAVATVVCTIAPVAIRRRHLRAQRDLDPLTGLGNRSLVEHRADTALPFLSTATVILIELDDVGEISEGLGHSTKDDVLRQVAASVREAAPSNATISRLSGSEFVIFAPELSRDLQEPLRTGVHAAIARPIRVADLDLVMRSTVGLATFPENGDSFVELLKHAESLVRRTRTRHKVRRDDSDHPPSDALNRLRSLHELRSTIGREQIVLWYQPKIRISTGTIDGVEALARWEHPTRGLLGPDQFIPLLEDAQLMTGWTHDILVEALDQAAQWAEQGLSMPVAVNVSGSSLTESGFVNQVLPLLHERGLSPALLTLEITEQHVIDDADRVASALSPLREAGVRISLDDFGTGFNSLTSLHDLVVAELKLDRSFVSALTVDARARALVRSIVSLARELGIDTVAEGVQIPEELTILAEVGCTRAQGYLISKPVPASAIPPLTETTLLPSREADPRELAVAEERE